MDWSAQVAAIQGGLDRGCQPLVLYVQVDRVPSLLGADGLAATGARIARVGCRLRQLVAGSGVVSDAGEWAWSVVLPDAVGPHGEAVAGILHRSLTGTDAGRYVSTSVGVARASGGAPPEVALGAAWQACAAATVAGGNRVWSDPGLGAAGVDDALVGDLADAVAAGSFRLLHQPKVALATGRVCGVECLVRWDRAEGPSVGPATFVPVAERCGLMPDLERRILALVADELAAVVAAVPGAAVALNVSAEGLLGRPLLDELVPLLERAAPLGARLVVEVTETALLEGTPEVRAVLARLRDAGAAISLDDFGTGCSSLSHLRDLTVDEVKIDRSFTSAVTVDASAAALTEAVARAASALGCEVVAEGVERPEEAEWLAEHHVGIAQGFLWSPPVAVADLPVAVAQIHGEG